MKKTINKPNWVRFTRAIYNELGQDIIGMRVRTNKGVQQTIQDGRITATIMGSYSPVITITDHRKITRRFIDYFSPYGDEDEAVHPSPIAEELTETRQVRIEHLYRPTTPSDETYFYFNYAGVYIDLNSRPKIRYFRCQRCGHKGARFKNGFCTDCNHKPF